MRKFLLVAAAAASLPLGACASYSNPTLASAGTGAAIGAAGGAGVAALAGGDLLTGAVIGAAVGGVAGAVWADRDNDGRADGYYRDGTYYSGAPAGYQSASSCRSVGGTAATGAGVGAAGGLGVAALTGGSLLAGAVIGAAVGGIAGAVWADSNNDGCVDGYYREGQYYQGEPMASQPVVQPVAYRRGERG